jgi:hypothetical protein
VENLRSEWKSKWRDDNGVIIGIDNAKDLLEELPNTIRQALGIVPSVELLSEDGKEYIVVSVDASSTPISFRGKHYLRSGSTTQELDGSDHHSVTFTIDNYGHITDEMQRDAAAKLDTYFKSLEICKG